MLSNRLETLFREYIGPLDVDDETKNILIGLKQYLYPSDTSSPLTYKDVMSLAIACAPETEYSLWDTITYGTNYKPQDNIMLDDIVNGVFHYYRERYGSELNYHIPNDSEYNCLNDLIISLREYNASSKIISIRAELNIYKNILNSTSDPILEKNLPLNINRANDILMHELTSVVYWVGKRNYVFPENNRYIDFENNIIPEDMDETNFKTSKKETQSQLRDFFAMVYNVILGRSDGPRLPQYINMLTIEKFIELVEKKLNE